MRTPAGGFQLFVGTGRWIGKGWGAGIFIGIFPRQHSNSLGRNNGLIRISIVGSAPRRFDLDQSSAVAVTRIEDLGKSVTLRPAFGAKSHR